MNSQISNQEIQDLAKKYASEYTEPMNQENPLEEMTKKYAPLSEYVDNEGYDASRDLFLKEPFVTDEITVVAFYTFENHVYIIDDEDYDCDPLDYFDDATMKRFIEYISDENNIH